MTPTVSILTASVPHRAEMLTEAVASVEAQTYPNVEHYVTVDTKRVGAGPLLNEMLDKATGEWVMVLDDDDLLDPDHVETVTMWTDDVDVIYTMPRVEGGTFVQYTREFTPERLAVMNCVSHNALMRTELVREIGGWNAVPHFDWDLFQRMEQAGAEFLQLADLTTWTYRLHGDNWSRGGLR